MNCENKKKFTELNAQIVNKNNKIKELNEKIKILTKADNANINIPKSKDKKNFQDENKKIIINKNTLEALNKEKNPKSKDKKNDNNDINLNNTKKLQVDLNNKKKEIEKLNIRINKLENENILLNNEKKELESKLKKTGKKGEFKDNIKTTSKTLNINNILNQEKAKEELIKNNKNTETKNENINEET